MYEEADITNDIIDAVDVADVCDLSMVSKCLPNGIISLQSSPTYEC